VLVSGLELTTLLLAPIILTLSSSRCSGTWWVIWLGSKGLLKTSQWITNSNCFRSSFFSFAYIAIMLLIKLELLQLMPISIDSWQGIKAMVATISRNLAELQTMSLNTYSSTISLYHEAELPRAVVEQEPIIQVPSPPPSLIPTHYQSKPKKNKLSSMKLSDRDQHLSWTKHKTVTRMKMKMSNPEPTTSSLVISHRHQKIRS